MVWSKETLLNIKALLPRILQASLQTKAEDKERKERLQRYRDAENLVRDRIVKEWEEIENKIRNIYGYSDSKEIIQSSDEK
jgi:predicted alternative tryptophan synthase beta-subunit